MGKGDKKTAKGKRVMGSYGNVRKKKSTKVVAVVKTKATKVKSEKPAAEKKATVKKTTTVKKASPKKATS